MPAHTTLTATPATSAHALTATPDVALVGTYPGADTYPGSDVYPGRGSDLVATTQASAHTLAATPIT